MLRCLTQTNMTTPQKRLVPVSIEMIDLPEDLCRRDAYAFIREMTEALAALGNPPGATISFESESGACRCYVEWQREETQEEADYRLRFEAKSAEEKERAERALYEYLKKKFS